MKDGQFLKTGCGSLHYAPPEIIMGKPYTGVEVDTWSCGVILFAMLTGYLPFDDDNHSVIVKRICTGNFTIPDHVSHDASDLIRKMLQVHPLDRIKMSDIKRHNFFNGQDRAQYIFQDLSNKDDKYKIQPQVLNVLLSKPFDFKGMDLSEIKDSIRCKKNLSFVIGY
jgi:5'-AMP-activated protein kinase, catalytic alpha subunit